MDDEEAFLDEREQAVPLLLKALEFGDESLKSEIIFLLGSFAKEEVARVYLQDLGHENADLRFDALALLGIVSSVEKHFEAYRQCLKDPDDRIRGLALRKLAEEGGSRLKEIKEEISSLLDDPNMDVKRAALEARKKV